MSPWVYLSAHLSAIFGFMGFFVGGAWSFAYPLFTFAFIPIIELFLSPRTANQHYHPISHISPLSGRRGICRF